MNSILKKSLSFLMVFCMMFVAFAFAVNASAASISITPNKATTGSSSTSYVSTETAFTANGVGYVINNWNPSSLQIRGNQTASTNMQSGKNFYIHNTTALPGAIESITLTYTAGSVVNSKVYAQVGTSVITNQTTGNSKTATAGTKQVTWTFTGSNTFFAIGMIKGGTSGTTNMGTLTITYADAPSTDPSINITAGASYVVKGNTVSFELTTENLEGADVEWVSSNEEVATVVDGTLTGLSTGVTNVKAVSGETESNEVEVKVYPDNTNPISIAEAIKVCETTGATDAPFAYTTIGTVADEPSFNSTYSSLTFNLTDGEDTIKIYGLKADSADALSVGDKIAVTGKLINYGGSTPEFNSNCTYVQYVTVTFMNEGLVWDTVELVAGETVEEPTGLTKDGYNLLGWLNGEFAWNFEDAVTTNLTLEANWVSTALEVYTVTFDVNGGNGEFDAQEIAEGTLVANPGNPTRAYATFLGWFNGEQQWDFEVDTPTADTVLVAKWDVLADSVIEFVETETKASLNFGYVASEAVATVAEDYTATMEYTGTTTGNMAATGNASKVNLDSTLFTVNASKGGANNLPGLNKAGNIRLYALAGGNGNELTVTVGNDYVIKSIKITFASTTAGGTLQIRVGEEKTGTDYADSATISTDINNSTFVLKNVTTTNLQIHIASIEITYGTDAPAVTYAFNDVAMRFQGALDAATYEDLLAQGAEVKFGVAAAKVAKLNGQTLFEAIDAEDANAKFIECQPALTQEGDTYLFALLLTNIPVEGFADEVVAAAYVEVDGVKHYMSVKQFSVNSLAQYYVNNLAEDTAVAAHIEALKALAKAN